jgi:signal transduction histidine kinase
MPRLFNAFQRLHGNVAGGEGIGLALVRRMVERHGGRVWAESKEGEGTTFYLTLPEATEQVAA